jgi:hypothetical protein
MAVEQGTEPTKAIAIIESAGGSGLQYGFVVSILSSVTLAISAIFHLPARSLAAAILPADNALPPTNSREAPATGSTVTH